MTWCYNNDGAGETHVSNPLTQPKISNGCSAMHRNNNAGVGEIHVNIPFHELNNK